MWARDVGRKLAGGCIVSRCSLEWDCRSNSYPQRLATECHTNLQNTLRQIKLCAPFEIPWPMTCEPPLDDTWAVHDYRKGGPSRTSSSSNKSCTGTIDVSAIAYKDNRYKQRPSSCCNWWPVNQQGTMIGKCLQWLTASEKISTTVVNNQWACWYIFFPYLNSFKSHRWHCSILNNLLIDVETSVGVKCGRICCDRYKDWVMRALKWDESKVIVQVCRPSGPGHDKNDLLLPDEAEDLLWY